MKAVIIQIVNPVRDLIVNYGLSIKGGCNRRIGCKANDRGRSLTG